MFTGSIWGAWAGLILIIIGFLLTIPVEGGRFTPKLLCATISSGALLYLQTTEIFPGIQWIQVMLFLIMLICMMIGMRETGAFGTIAAVGEALLAYGLILVIHSLYAALGTIAVLSVVHWIRHR